MELVTEEEADALRGAGQPRALARRSPRACGVPLGDVEARRRFANGEIYCRYGESIRGADVFIVQSHCEPINDRIMEQLIMIDAAKRASAKRITAVCPFYGYARQDRKAEGREPITARLLADMLTVAGADRVRSRRPPHRPDPGLLRLPVDHLTAVPLLADVPARARSRATRSSSCRPTPAACKLARRFANYLERADVEPTSPSSTSAGRRAPTTSPRPSRWSATSSGGICVLIDDMIDTAGTITCGRQAADRPGRQRGLTSPPPTACCRARPSIG